MASPKQAQLWIVNLISCVLLFLLAVTGLVNWLVLPHGGDWGGSRGGGLLVETRHLIRDVHAWVAVLFMIAVAVHLVLHWPYIRSNLARMGWLAKEQPERNRP